MCGCFEIEFKYSETFSPKGDYVESKDYKTKALEWATLILDEKNELSIQHLLIINDSMVIKHWRQDWEYESEKTLDFVANNTWNINNISKKEVKGQWAQKVYLDKQGRRHGKWVHYLESGMEKSMITYTHGSREGSVRDDYDVIIGINTQTITPTGWVHEQNNKKVLLNNGQEVLAKEIGIARYERIKNFNWDAGNEYWDKTNIFWAQVRETWNKKLNNSKVFKLKNEVNGEILFSKLFMLADQFAQGEKEATKSIQAIVDTHSKQ